MEKEQMSPITGEKEVQAVESHDEHQEGMASQETINALMEEIHAKSTETEALMSEMGGEEKVAESFESFDDSQKATVMSALESIQSKRKSNQEVIDVVNRFRDPRSRALGLAWYKGIKDTYYKVREQMAK